MRNKKYRVVIIEPAEIVALGIKNILSSTNNFELTHHFTSITKALEKAHILNADIIIVNPQFTTYQKKNILKEFGSNIKFAAILYTYIEKEQISNFKEVIEIYDTPADIIKKLNNLLKSTNHNSNIKETEELSGREKEILIAVSKGFTNKEIASQFNISIHTVISHRKNISKKTGIKSASGFAVYALLNNLIPDTII